MSNVIIYTVEDCIDSAVRSAFSVGPDHIPGFDDLTEEMFTEAVKDTVFAHVFGEFPGEEPDALNAKVSKAVDKYFTDIKGKTFAEPETGPSYTQEDKAKLVKSSISYHAPITRKTS